jgi:hypothetical protein
MDLVVDGYSFIVILYAFFLVITSFALAMTASVPRPDSLVGKIGFFLWTCCVVLSYLFVLMSLVSFVTANTSASALYADCLAEGIERMGNFQLFKLFNLVGIFSGAFHPFVISCLCLMMMYSVLLFEAYRVWKARHGGDTLSGKYDGILGVTKYLTLFHSIWPLFNLFIWVFSVAFVFSLSFLPSFLLLAGIMYVWVVLLGLVHHYWAAPIINGKWTTTYGATDQDPEDKMESWLPKPVVEILYNITAPYHVFGTRFNVFREVYIAQEDRSGTALAFPVFATLLLFSLSTLATSGAHVALHVYSGHNGGELINELYRFQYDSFTHTPRFNMRIFDLDFAKALESLPTSFDLGSLPDLSWGPENFAQLARSQNTLTLLVSLIRCAIAVVFFALQACGFASPSIGTAKAAGGRKMSMAVLSATHRGPVEEELAGDLSTKELADDLSTKELANDLSTKELADDLSTKELADDLSTKELANDLSTKELADDLSTKELANDLTTKELADDLSTKELAGDLSTKELADDLSTKELANDLSTKELANDLTTKELADDLSTKELANVVDYMVPAPPASLGQVNEVRLMRAEGMWWMRSVREGESERGVV